MYNAAAVDRDELIAKRIGEGQTLASIARELGISRQRVHQITCKLKLQAMPKGPPRGTKPETWVTDGKPETGRIQARKLYPILGLCEICGKNPATDRHHKDGNTFNNARSNLVFACRGCHSRAHRLLDKRFVL